MDLTTLQLARRIADAVGFAFNQSIAAGRTQAVPDHEHWPTQAVLLTLRETDSWFCRVSQDAKGYTVHEQYELFPAEGAQG